MAAVTGDRAVLANLRLRLERINDNVQGAMTLVVADLKSKSQDIVPVDTGLLRSTANYRVKRGRNYIRGSVGYNTHYALEQHENLNYRHKPGKFAKYLTTPLYLNASRYFADIEAAGRRAVT